jgi:hypothetical protein
MGHAEAQEEGLRIIGLHVDGFRRIRVVDITPPSNGVVRIVGANEAGKTSLLDSIMAALKGLPKGSMSPLQRGRERGEVVLNMGAFQIQVIYTESGEYLNVKRGDGKVAKPRAFLDEMIGQGLSFDPFAFARLKPAEQVNTLLSALQLEQDPGRSTRSARGTTSGAPTRIGRSSRSKRGSRLFPSSRTFPTRKSRLEISSANAPRPSRRGWSSRTSRRNSPAPIAM